MRAANHRANQENQAKRACLSCQRRRRWCDRTLPNCLICREAGRQCEGYAEGAIRTFINLNASNVSRTNKKRLLCEAIADMKQPSANVDRNLDNATSTGDFSAFSSHGVAQFGREELISLKISYPQQVAALWRTFVVGYCQTDDYWPPGCSRLMLRNKALDLSIVALSAQRLSLNMGNEALHIMSLTAYNNSIGLYRDTMQQWPSSGLAAILAVISTVYALVDACLNPPKDMAEFSWGSSGHFDGALTLMRQSGPDQFSKEGFHLVFKKIREMGFFLALSRRQKTFLSKDEWMSNPWTSAPKTWRDRLYDLALRFSELTAGHGEVNESSDHLGVTREWISKAMEIEADLARWRLSWLNEAYPHQQISCDCQPPAPFSCICSVLDLKFPNTNFALLQLECWSLQLLISTTLSRLLVPDADLPTSWIKTLPTRSSQIASYMETASALPALRSALKASSGVTEGFCRNIFPYWILRDYQSRND